MNQYHAIINTTLLQFWLLSLMQLAVCWSTSELSFSSHLDIWRKQRVREKYVGCSVQNTRTLQIIQPSGVLAIDEKSAGVAEARPHRVLHRSLGYLKVVWSEVCMYSELDSRLTSLWRRRRMTLTSWSTWHVHSNRVLAVMRKSTPYQPCQGFASNPKEIHS